MNVAGRLSDVARRYGDKRSIVFENHEYSFHDVDRHVERYAALLARLDVKIGDRVAIQLTKRMEFIFLELAVLSLGAIVIPINPDCRPQEVEYFLADSASSLYITDHERFSRAQPHVKGLSGLRTVLVGPAEEAGVLSLAAELEATQQRFARTNPAAEDNVAFICYTSGTTGKPKGAMITHRNLVANMTALHEIWEWSDRDVLLHMLPLFHVHGLFVALHGALNAGATIVMHEKFDPLRTWQTVEHQRCTVVMGVPTMYQRMLNQWEQMDRRPDLKSMRVFVSGSAPLLETQFHRFEQATGFRVLERYGMTESGMITSNTIDPAGRTPKSVGYRLPGGEIRVVSDQGRDVTSGDVGEVWVCGHSIFAGYWGMPEKTRESFCDGWFKTGDLGYQDAKDRGRLYLVGRAKELIITGGYNVYPKEVENLLESLDTIKEAAVIGLPDEDFGERVIAVVVPREGITAPSPEAVIGYCKSRLAGYKCPRAVFLVDGLPRNAMGKLLKGALVDRFREDG